jgi:hypothetical protein
MSVVSEFENNGVGAYDDYYGSNNDKDTVTALPIAVGYDDYGNEGASVIRREYNDEEDAQYGAALNAFMTSIDSPPQQLYAQTTTTTTTTTTASPPPQYDFQTNNEFMEFVRSIDSSAGFAEVLLGGKAGLACYTQNHSDKQSLDQAAASVFEGFVWLHEQQRVVPFIRGRPLLFNGQLKHDQDRMFVLLIYLITRTIPAARIHRQVPVWAFRENKQVVRRLVDVRWMLAILIKNLITPATSAAPTPVIGKRNSTSTAANNGDDLMMALNDTMRGVLFSAHVDSSSGDVDNAPEAVPDVALGWLTELWTSENFASFIVSPHQLHPYDVWSDKPQYASTLVIATPVSAAEERSIKDWVHITFVVPAFESLYYSNDAERFQLPKFQVAAILKHTVGAFVRASVLKANPNALSTAAATAAVNNMLARFRASLGITGSASQTAMLFNAEFAQLDTYIDDKYVAPIRRAKIANPTSTVCANYVLHHFTEHVLGVLFDPQDIIDNRDYVNLSVESNLTFTNENSYL